WQDHSWSDTRALAQHLASHMERGDRIVAESSWNYTLYLYPRGLIRSPAEVIDANYAPRDDHRDLCEIPWLVGNPESAAMIRDALGRCRHERVRSSTTWHYYFDTTRLRLSTSPVVVGLYRLEGPWSRRPMARASQCREVDACARGATDLQRSRQHHGGLAAVANRRAL